MNKKITGILFILAGLILLFATTNAQIMGVLLCCYGIIKILKQ